MDKKMILTLLAGMVLAIVLQPQVSTLPLVSPITPVCCLLHGRGTAEILKVTECARLLIRGSQKEAARDDLPQVRQHSRDRGD